MKWHKMKIFLVPKCLNCGDGGWPTRKQNRLTDSVPVEGRRQGNLGRYFVATVANKAEDWQFDSVNKNSADSGRRWNDHQFFNVRFADVFEMADEASDVANTDHANDWCRFFAVCAITNCFSVSVSFGQLHRMSQTNVALVYKDAAERWKLARHFFKHLFQQIFLLAAFNLFSTNLEKY